MMNSNIRVKSALLALTMIMAVPTPSRAEVPAASEVNSVVVFAQNNPLLVTALVGFIYVVKTRLKTKPRQDYKLDQWRDDLKKLLNSFNIFDTKLYAQLVYIFDKYVVGAEFKREETTTRTKNEDGSVFTVKGTKVVQKPFGVYGYVDAYVVKQMKDTVDLLPVAAAFYILLNNPDKSLKSAFTGNK
ncbi:MAG TPA: hypothetical protein VJJ26_02360 [Candidatus Babeliales bacterium]|nr:hypothetical protein [Candidatus Babeliales bacterium]